MILTFNHLDHVVDYMSVPVLRAENDDLGIGVDLYIMPRRPIKPIIRIDSFLDPVSIGGSHLTAQQVIPMRAKA